MRIVDVAVNMRFGTLPICWRNCGEYDSGSGSRVVPGSKYIYYNVHYNRALSENEVYRLAHWNCDKLRMVIHKGGIIMQCPKDG